jgi:hypothetical protein
MKQNVPNTGQKIYFKKVFYNFNGFELSIKSKLNSVLKKCLPFLSFFKLWSKMYPTRVKKYIFKKFFIILSLIEIWHQFTAEPTPFSQRRSKSLRSIIHIWSLSMKFAYWLLQWDPLLFFAESGSSLDLIISVMVKE